MTTCNTCSNAIPDPAEEWPDGNGGTSREKPPLGLRPRFIVDEDRLREIEAAITRLKTYGWRVPAEWLTERDEIDARVQARAMKPQPHGGHGGACANPSIIPTMTTRNNATP
jgi:hypothetical protein